ncbi:hypothetical protein XAP6164_70007 [Xanthomonas phaseoli pv. phaseoli]|nr:hypothetical protein XAP6164_70007 [Xanthomonas phaseoli pv. phaseoli]
MRDTSWKSYWPRGSCISKLRLMMNLAVHSGMYQNFSKIGSEQLE